MKVDSKNKIICIKGSTPGSKGSWLVIEDSIKQKNIKEIDTILSAQKSQTGKKEQKEQKE